MLLLKYRNKDKKDLIKMWNDWAFEDKRLSLFKIINLNSYTLIKDKKKNIGMFNSCVYKDKEEYNIYIYSFYIKPEYRFKGIGTKVLNEIKKEMFFNSSIILTCEEENLNFYLKNGFKTINKFINEYDSIEYWLEYKKEK